MITSVSERCRAVATFRHVSVWLMETAARWTPTTPEMEVKVMLGRHIWDFAQMANVLGKRTFELRRHEHYTLAPVDIYATLLSDAAAARSTADRISIFYDGIIPGLIERYRSYVAQTDKILDEPSIVIAERNLRELERQRAEAETLQHELKLKSAAGDAIVSRDRAIGSIFAEVEPA